MLSPRYRALAILFNRLMLRLMHCNKALVKLSVPLTLSPLCPVPPDRFVVAEVKSHFSSFPFRPPGPLIGTYAYTNIHTGIRSAYEADTNSNFRTSFFR